MGTKGSVGDDSEPREIKKHSSVKIDNNVDLRINVLREYIEKVPGARIQDLKKSLEHYSKFNDGEFKNLVKSASIDKYNELYLPSQKISSKPDKPVSTATFTLPQYTLEEVRFLEKYRNTQLQRSEIYEEFKIECPRYPRKIQFISDYFHNYPQGPPTRFVEELKNPPKVITSHVVTNQQNSNTNHHILAQAINSLYKSGKSPALFSQIKPVLELINDPNEVEFAIECLTS